MRYFLPQTNTTLRWLSFNGSPLSTMKKNLANEKQNVQSLIKVFCLSICYIQNKFWFDVNGATRSRDAQQCLVATDAIMNSHRSPSKEVIKHCRDNKALQELSPPNLFLVLKWRRWPGTAIRIEVKHNREKTKTEDRAA